VNGVTEVYTYDAADKLLNVKVNGIVVKSFTYDLAGRTTGITDAGGTTTFSYDYEDRVTSIARLGMTTNAFAYNGFGARVSKTDSGGSNTYLRASSGLIGSIVADSGATYTPGVSEKRGTTSTFCHADIKNSVAQTSTTQTVVASKQYDAFGNEVSSSGAWQGPFQYGGAFGYHTDTDYGLKHLGARYYDPTTRRFLSRDPIKDGRNWYSYARNNPVRFVDPLGLAYWEFDGKEMRSISDNGKRKRVVARIPVASGAPGSTPADQSRQDYGPIPEGTWYVDPNEIGQHVRFECWPGPNFRQDRDVWGDWRVALHPLPGTDTLGRDGFFVHGGKYIGSIGCIDVGWNDWKVMQLIQLWGDGKPMLVKVRYEDRSAAVPGTKQSPVAWPLGGGQ
jgi:RHS repeat-associated protein